MAAKFHTVLPDVPIIRSDGNALPLADASQDLLTYAQSWLWTDTTLSVPEALRVLLPAGALAIWWNTTAFDVPWIREQHQRIARHCGVKPTSRVRPDDRDTIRECLAESHHDLQAVPADARRVRQQHQRQPGAAVPHCYLNGSVLDPQGQQTGAGRVLTGVSHQLAHRQLHLPITRLDTGSPYLACTAARKP